MDLQPWAGDRAMASLVSLKPKEEETPIGPMRHMIIDCGYKRSSLGANFSQARVANEVAHQWMSRKRVLHDYVKDSLGQVSMNPKHPVDSVPEPDEETLKQVPGALEAWRGLRALEMRTCIVRGGKVLIDPAKLAVFQQAPLGVSNAIKELEVQHEPKTDILSFMETRADDPEQPPADPRHESEEEEGDHPEWMKLATEAALHDHFKGDTMTSHTAMGEKNVTLIRNETKGDLWVMAKEDNITLRRWLCLGGFGSGLMKPHDPENLANSIPFDLMKDGDKSLSQVVQGTIEESKINTFYSQIKPLEKAAAQSGNHLKVTGYGKVLPEGEAGKHRFIFEFPTDHPKHLPHTFYLQTSLGKSITSGNFFTALPNSDWEAGGAQLAWRFGYEPVTHQLVPKKPFVVTKQAITLTKGMPLRIVWKKED